MVLTDGKMTKDRQSLTALSSKLQKKGINVFAVGVGSAFEQSELEEIATVRENVYTSSFERLQELSAPVRKAFCRGNCGFEPHLRRQYR